MTTAIILAAGKSERIGGKVDKSFLSLGSKPVLAYSLAAFDSCSEIDSIVLVVRREQQIAAKGVVQMFGCRKVSQIIAGGATRIASVRNGLNACDPDTKIVCIHDAARPCVAQSLISEVVNMAKNNDCGVAACQITDTLKLVKKNNIVSSTIDRSKIWATQTPQAFKFELLKKAYDAIRDNDETITDDASAVEALEVKVHLVQSTLPNIKITFAEDIKIAARLLGVN